MSKLLRKLISQLIRWPKVVKHQLHENFPQIFGHEIQNNLVQFYRNDDLFQTAISFNHFIEFFSQLSDINMILKVEAHNRLGRSLGIKSFTVEKKGAKQFLLNELFSNLDSFGLFSVSLKLTPRYTDKIAYLGKISPQFMTIYIPQSDICSPQMIHSHRLKQGHLFLPRNSIRASSHIETLDQVNRFDLFVLNSSKSKLEFKVIISDGKSESSPVESSVSLAGFATACLSYEKSEFAPNFNNLSFKYFFNRSVDHKKPIIFRQFHNNSWSCNHT